VDHRYAECRPTTRWRRATRHIRLLRSVRLNVAGWSAFAVSTLAGAGVGYATGRLLGLPVERCLAGGVAAVLAGVVLADRRMWTRVHSRGSARRRPPRR
jgi:hypothetical protein